MVHLIHKRVFNLLQKSAVRVTVKCSPGGQEALGLPTPYIALNIALPSEKGFVPQMNLELDDEGFEANLSLFKQPVRRVRVLWPSVVDVTPITPPTDGGTRNRATA
jgi:hypothetical protein